MYVHGQFAYHRSGKNRRPLSLTGVVRALPLVAPEMAPVVNVGNLCKTAMFPAKSPCLDVALSRVSLTSGPYQILMKRGDVRSRIEDYRIMIAVVPYFFKQSDLCFW